MPTFQQCDKTVYQMGNAILVEFESHKPLIEAKVIVDYVFAFCDRDEQDQPLNCALKHNGVKALGIAKIMPLKDRAMGRGDVEVCLDGDYWKGDATEEQRAALLDHELHHFALKLKDKQFTYDSLGRPKLRMRQHDVDVGWFRVIADRHGAASQERIQAAAILDTMGQYFWPQLAGTVAKQIGKGK